MSRYQMRIVNGSLWLLCLLPLAFLSLRTISVPAEQSLPRWLNGEESKLIEHNYDESLVLKSWSVNLWAALDYALLGEGQPGVVIGKDEWLLTREEYQWPSDAEGRLQQAMQEIGTVYRQLQDKGLAVSVVLIPEKIDIYSDKLLQSSPQQTHHLYELALYGLRQQNIPVQDLRPVLINGRREGETFLRTDTHWTPLGAELIAKAVVLQAGWLGATPRYRTEQNGYAEYRGDLLNYIPVAPHLSALGPRPDNLALVTTELITTAQNDDLFANTPAVSQVLIGTSYSANEKWNFAGALKQFTGQDLLNLAEEGKGPFVPMRHWLQQNGTAQTGLQRVIWEIPVRYLLQYESPNKANI